MLVLAFSAFVKVSPVAFDGGLLAGADDLFLVEGGGLQAHVHEVLVDSRVVADFGMGGVVPGLDVLLEGGAEQVDVLHHPVVGDAFPNVFGFGLGLEVDGPLSEVHIVDGRVEGDQKV